MPPDRVPRPRVLPRTSGILALRADQPAAAQRLRCRAIVPLLFFSLLSQESPEAPYLVRTTSLRSSRLGSKTRSLAKRPIDRAGDLLAGPGSYRAAQRRLPLFGCHRRMVEPEIREHRGLINVASDLLGATPGGDVLSARQLRAPAGAREAQEVLHHQRHRPPRTLRPRRVRGRLDDNLADDPPARVVGVTAGYEEPRERLGHAYGLWLGPVSVEVSQRRTHAAAVVDRLGELTRGPSRLACFIVDRSTVLAENLGSARVEARIEEGGHGGAAALDRGVVAILEQAFRDQWGRVLAALIGFLGDFDLAEEAAQEAFAIAAEGWPRDGAPAIPSA
jgi:hypothetical protein